MWLIYLIGLAISNHQWVKRFEFKFLKFYASCKVSDLANIWITCVRIISSIKFVCLNHSISPLWLYTVHLILHIKIYFSSVFICWMVSALRVYAPETIQTLALPLPLFSLNSNKEIFYPFHPCSPKALSIPWMSWI